MIDKSNQSAVPKTGSSLDLHLQAVASNATRGHAGAMNPTPNAIGPSKTPNVWIVVPALNEAGRVGAVVHRLRSVGGNVVVVDDGSTDETSSESLAAGAHVLSHMVNRGQGAALQTGFQYCLSQDCDVVVSFDADGQHSESEITALIQPILDGQADVVLGSRFLGSAVGMPAHRHWLLKLATWFTRITTGLQVTDTHNGIRAFSQSAVRQIRITEDRMAHASDLLHQIASLGLRFQECPVTIKYTDETIRKGQRSSAAVGILSRVFVSRLLQ